MRIKSLKGLSCLLVGWSLVTIKMSRLLPHQDRLGHLTSSHPAAKALQTFAASLGNDTNLSGTSSKDGSISAKGLEHFLLNFDDGHVHSLPPECTKDATPMLFKEWRESKETICEHGKMVVEQYTMKRWEPPPSFIVYKNVPIRRFYSQESVNCEELKKLCDEHKLGAKTAITHTRPVIRVKAFDPFNSYERFHAHLNVAMAMATFNITDPQIVDMITEKHVEIDRGVPQHDMEMYSAFSSTKPLIVAHGSDKDVENVLFVPYMIDAFGSGTSILVAKTSGAFRGRGADHHCKSSIFQGITRWMKANLLGDEFNYETFEGGNMTNKTIQVVWSSRAPYCCRPRGKLRTPKRPISNEDELVRRVGQALGDKYNTTFANFGNMSTHDSVAIASRSSILVGVHGAGLVWSSFLPPHSGIVELFGGDRGRGNRHYHNIASLADLHYRSLSLRGPTSGLVWNNDTVEQIARKIRSVNLGQEPGASEPKG